MSRYIDAEKLLKAMDTWDKFGYTHTGAFVRNPKTEDYVPYVHYEDMVKCVSNFPTANVVEVVRCKDCKHNREHETPMGNKFHLCNINKLAFTQYADFYCAYGERREDAEIH